MDRLRFGVKRCDCGTNIAESMKSCQKCEIAALRQRIKELEEEVVSERLRIVRGEFAQICSYCGWESRIGGWDELQQHIHECEQHPVSKINAKLSRYEAVIAAARIVVRDVVTVNDEECDKEMDALADALAALDKEEK